MGRLRRILALIVIALVLLSVPILAVVIYRAPIAITESSSTAYTMLPITVPAPNTFLAANNFFKATALDTRVETLGGLARKHLVATDRTLFAMPILADSQANMYFTTGNTDLTSLAIIAGYNGYYTIPYAPALEFVDDFKSEFSGYVDTSAGANKYLIYKGNAFTIDAGSTTAGEVTATISAITAQNTGATLLSLYAGSNTRFGEYLTNFTGTISSVGFRLSKGGTPGGSFIVRIRSVAGDAILAEMGSMTANDLTIVPTFYDFYGSSATVVATDLRITVEYTGGDAANAVIADYNAGGSVFAGGELTAYNAGYTEYPAQEAVFRYATPLSVSTALAPGEYTIKATADGTDFKLYIDGTEEDSIALGGAFVPANANNWIINQNNVMPYITYYKHTVGVPLVAHYQPITIIANTGQDSTADAGGDANTIIDAALTQVDDYWNGARVIIVTTTDGLAPQGENAVVLDFADATNEITLATNLTAGVDAGDTFTVDFGTLPDREGAAQDARITWGVNPTGVAVTLGSMVPASQPVPGQLEEEPTRDILPPAGSSDWNAEPAVAGALLTHPLRPLITMVSDNTTLTESQTWIWYGIAFVLFFTGLAIRYIHGHRGFVGIAFGVSMIAVVAQSVFPIWSVALGILALVLGVVSERNPSL